MFSNFEIFSLLIRTETVTSTNTLMLESGEVDDDECNDAYPILIAGIEEVRP